MRRYISDLNLEIGKTVEIDGELFKHVVVVCRNQSGDQFELLVDDLAYLVELTTVNKKAAQVQVLEKRKIPDLPKPYIHLVLSNPKVQVLESVVEKSVELGVKSIFLLVTENSFFKSASKLKQKEKRLEKIISQALQQTNRHERLTVHGPMALGDFLEVFESMPEKAGWLMYEKAPLSQKFGEVDQGLQSVCLLVGPEGGFTEPEVKLANSYGFKSISLGSQILRVETACVAGVSILKSKLQTW